MAETLVIVPTRGRPHNAKRLLDTAKNLMYGETRFLFCVDDNDPELRGYEINLPEEALRVGQPRRLGPWLNAVSAEMVDRYEVIAFMGDDHLPATSGWDTKLRDVLREAGPRGVAYGDDGYQGEALPTAVFMRSELIKELGWMVPPGLEHLYIDNAWKSIGLVSGGLRYVPDVKIIHVHPVVGMAEEDETYRAGNSPAQYASDKEAYVLFECTVLPGLFREGVKA